MILFNRFHNCFKKYDFESEKNFKVLIETIQDGVFVIQNDKFVFVNKSFCDITEKSKKELIGKNIFDSLEIHPDDKKIVYSNYKNRLNNQTNISNEYSFRAIRKEKEIYLYMNVGVGIYKGKNAIMGTIKDVTTKHIQDSSLLTLKNAVKQSPVGVVITDKEGIIEYINPKFTEMTGYDFSDVEGKTPRILKSGEHDENFYEDMWERLTSGKEWSSELKNKKKDGTLYWEKQSISPLVDEETNKIYGYVGMKEDITGLKKLNERLVKEKEKAQESDKLKTAFLASMSHEIRTPMNSIIGFTDLLRDESMSKEKKEKYTNHIQNAGLNLLNLIDDIIDIAKIESKQLKITQGTCDLSELMDQLLKTHTENKNKNSKNHVELIPNGDNVKEKLVIKTDEHRLTQILNNLIGNALKFTEKGYVRFGYTTINDNLLQFYVKDTGIGIPDEEKDFIFDRFRRVENDEKIYSGTGLGLAITKNLVELLGGKIWLESTEDIGTIFYFTLPFEKISKTKRIRKKIKKVEKFNWEDKTILVAEDEQLNYNYLDEVISRTKATVIWAQNGKKAINLYRRHKKRINVILMDIKMPEMSGYDVIKKIREYDENVPIIVQTAHVISGEKNKSFEAGCDEYLTKPIKYDKLLNTMNKYIKYESKT